VRDSSKRRKTKRVFSGIQPSGSLHIGNYLGAIKHWIDSQDTVEMFICIVDLHAITVYQDPRTLTFQTRQLAALLYACGIDTEKTTLFVQSHVSAHAECAWILGCVTPLGWLERMTQFKAKAAGQESVLTGYPRCVRAVHGGAERAGSIACRGIGARTCGRRSQARRGQETGRLGMMLTLLEPAKKGRSTER